MPPRLMIKHLIYRFTGRSLLTYKIRFGPSNHRARISKIQNHKTFLTRTTRKAPKYSLATHSPPKPPTSHLLHAAVPQLHVTPSLHASGVFTDLRWIVKAVRIFNEQRRSKICTIQRVCDGHKPNNARYRNSFKPRFWLEAYPRPVRKGYLRGFYSATPGSTTTWLCTGKHSFIHHLERREFTWLCWFFRNRKSLPASNFLCADLSPPYTSCTKGRRRWLKCQVFCEVKFRYITSTSFQHSNAPWTTNKDQADKKRYSPKKEYWNFQAP